MELVHRFTEKLWIKFPPAVIDETAGLSCIHPAFLNRESYSKNLVLRRHAMIKCHIDAKEKCEILNMLFFSNFCENNAYVKDLLITDVIKSCSNIESCSITQAIAVTVLQRHFDFVVDIVFLNFLLSFRLTFIVYRWLWCLF